MGSQTRTEQDAGKSKSNEKPKNRPKIQLIVGHATHDSVWLWVRGTWLSPRLRVEVREEGPKLGDERHPIVRTVWVNPWRDYTTVIRLNATLEPCTPYTVTLRSTTTLEHIEGRFRTFPRRDDPRPFTFLHGSCNLSVDRLTALGAMASAFIGTGATTRALELPRADWDVHRLPVWARPVSVPGVHLLSRELFKCLNIFVLGFARQTRYEQPEPLLPSPFERIVDEEVKARAPDERPAFMIHCGDQIYFDVDFPPRRGKEVDYRRNYRQAWFKDEKAHALLRSMPHYMVLDDHEVWDSYGTDPDPEIDSLEEAALSVYDEYVSARQPQERNQRYYTFEHGDTDFFVLDTRTERTGPGGKGTPKIVSDDQLTKLVNWLRSDREGLKFVVSSVPFVAQVRPPGLDPDGTRRADSQSDKWSSEAWQEQREKIIKTIYLHGIDRVVFLVGDMHATYHATMQIGTPERRLTVHELAGGPFNQLEFAKRDDFYARFVAACDVEKKGRKVEVPWVSTLHAFHGAAPSVLSVSVTPGNADEPPKVDWRALRTKAEPRPPSTPIEPRDPHHLRGRIRFYRKPTGPIQ